MQLAKFDNAEQVTIRSEVSLRVGGDDDVTPIYRVDYVLQSESSPPVLVEIMTCSTSGGNKNKGTDITSAFCNAVLYAHGITPNLGQSPNVNKRQVWARMSSQLIAKSQIANAWGGCSIWVVQDVLVQYINSQTGLDIERLRRDQWVPGEVNLISVNINDPNDLVLYAGPIRPRDGEPGWTDILTTAGGVDLQQFQESLSDLPILTTLSMADL